MPNGNNPRRSTCIRQTYLPPLKSHLSHHLIEPRKDHSGYRRNRYRRGHLPEYQKYRAEVSVLVPLPRGCFKSSGDAVDTQDLADAAESEAGDLFSLHGHQTMPAA